MRKHRFVYSLGLLPLLMGAGDTETRESALTVDRLPICADGQFLVARGNGLACDAPGGSGIPGLVDCQTQGQLLTYARAGSDIPTFSCVMKGSSSGQPIDSVLLTKVSDKLTKLKDLVKEIETTPAPAAKFYVGSTAAKYNGQLGAGAADASLKVAADKCAAEFGAGAQMCTIYDLYNSAASGKLTTAMTIPQAQRAWIWAPAWNTPAGLPGGAAREPLAGVSDTCGGYTYPTGDLAWAGTAFSWENSMTGRKALKIHGGTAARCSDNLAIACCK
jgi:hypothetical protein